MFDVDANLWLQQFDTSWFRILMAILSELGQAWVFTPVVLALAFGVRLRPALGVMLALVLTGAVVDTAKRGFALPRPSEIDARVLDKGHAGRHVVADGAARGFWAAPPEAAVEAVRSRGRHDYGFISGHVASAAALSLSVVLLFGVRRRLAWSLAIGWPVLMALSRMYLGRHFLADVLGGLVAGAGIALLVAAFLRAAGAGPARARVAWGAAAAAVGGAGGLSAMDSMLSAYEVGSVGGALLCLAWVHGADVPDSATGLWRQVACVVLAIGFAYGAGAALDAAYDAGGWADGATMGGLFALVGYPLSIVGALVLLQALRLFPRNRRSVVAAGSV